jgi:hypothetical protein
VDDETARYHLQRSGLALLGLGLLAFGWIVGESMLVRGSTGGSGVEYGLGGIIMVGGVVGGLLLIIIGNIVLYRRYKDRNRDA